jgi:uncharacterized protein YcgI (DUF1989 family)
VQSIGEIPIPAGYAKAFIIMEGQYMKICQVEGKQTGDLVVFNADDLKEHFCVGQSLALNEAENIGNMKFMTKLYSQPSRENVMLRVTKDTTKVHLAWSGSRCSPRLYELLYKTTVPPHRSCQTNLAEALAPFGLTRDEVPDVYNLFMNVDIVNGKMIRRPPVAQKDDYVEMRAEMNCLVALSSCPSDLGVVNEGRIKPLVVKISQTTLSNQPEISSRPGPLSRFSRIVAHETPPPCLTP